MLRIKLKAQLREFSHRHEPSCVRRKRERNSNEVHQPDFIPFFGNYDVDDRIV